MAGLGVAVIVVGVGVIVLATTVFQEADGRRRRSSAPTGSSILIKAAIASGKLSTRWKSSTRRCDTSAGAGDAKGAVVLANRAVTVAEKLHGKGSPELVRMLSWAGASFAIAERFGEAEPLYSRAAMLHGVRTGSPTQRELARVMRQLAEVRMRLGQF